MIGEFSGVNAVVTGAASGIGRAVTLRLAGSGAHVLACDRDADGAAQTARMAGTDVFPAAVDVADPGSVARLFEEADRELAGGLGVLVNVAGIGSTTTAPETSPDVWARVMDVNATGTFLTCREAVPRMIAAGGGSIVNVASIAGLVGLRNRAAYCASKGAVIALTRAMALDHVASGVRVNCVCPGTVDSPWVRRLVDDVGESVDDLAARQPMGRLGTPDEIAEAISYLAGDRSGFVTGSALVIDGGLTAG